MDLQGHEDLKMAQPKPNSEMKSSELLKKLSHELRTPLNTIMGFAGLMKDPVLSAAERDQYIDRILSNGDYVLQILEDALNFAKVEAGEARLNQVSFNLSDMVYDLARTLKDSAKKKGMDIHIVFKSPIPETILSDPLKVRQILSNLIGNVIRYSEGDGFILISMSYPDAPTGPKEVVVEVDDSGCESSQGEAPTTDRRLARLEASFNREDELVRPGFVLSKEFANLLGGDLEIKPSEFGGGHSFSFRIPAGNQPDVPLLSQKSEPKIAQKILESLQRKSDRLAGVRILLAEDSSDNEALMHLFLQKEGVALTSVSNGLEAIDAVKNGDFDLILMDIQMPLMDGLEATRQIRQMGFEKPIIALTGDALLGDAERSLRAGCSTHLTKPIRKEALISEIQKHVFH